MIIGAKKVQELLLKRYGSLEQKIQRFFDKV